MKEVITIRSKNRQNNQSETKHMTHYQVEQETELLQFLLDTFQPQQSRTAIKKMLTREQVHIDGQPITQHNHPLKPGQTIGIMNQKRAKQKTALTEIPILYEDDTLIVIDKPAGILSIAANDPKAETAYKQLTDYVKIQGSKNRIFIVHRLDRDTSGVMLFAKTAEAKELLQANWQKSVSERQYTAAVIGHVAKKKDTIESWLSQNKNMQIYSTPFDNGGKHSVTYYQVIQQNKQYSLLEVHLDTGRKNQIRVHMQSIGHPVVGDSKYGGKSSALKRLGLHATTLAFTHPLTHEKMSFSSKVPNSFFQLTK